MKCLYSTLVASFLTSAYCWIPQKISFPNAQQGLTPIDAVLNRRFFLGTAAVALCVPRPANALVKGVAPPTKSKPASGKPKCTNVEECQAMAQLKEQEQRDIQDEGPPPKVTAAGTKYRDIDSGDNDAGSIIVKEGDEVTMYYKILKLGKRSYDGLSGEGTVVFSRGECIIIVHTWLIYTECA